MRNFWLDTAGGFGTVNSVVTIDMINKLRITDIAKATGLSKSTLIRYEDEGKLPPSKRDGRKWRYYSQQDCDHIVAVLKELKLI